MLIRNLPNVSTASFSLICFANNFATFASFVWNLRKSLINSTARSPEPATTSVWGWPFSTEDSESVWPFFLRRDLA